MVTQSERPCTKKPRERKNGKSKAKRDKRGLGILSKPKKEVELGQRRVILVVTMSVSHRFQDEKMGERGVLGQRSLMGAGQFK